MFKGAGTRLGINSVIINVTTEMYNVKKQEKNNNKVTLYFKVLQCNYAFKH